MKCEFAWSVLVSCSDRSKFRGPNGLILLLEREVGPLAQAWLKEDITNVTGPNDRTTVFHFSKRGTARWFELQANFQGHPANLLAEDHPLRFARQREFVWTAKVKDNNTAVALTRDWLTSNVSDEGVKWRMREVYQAFELAFTTRHDLEKFDWWSRLIDVKAK